MPPEIPMRSQIEAISEPIVVNISRERDLSKIVYLNLFNNKIKKIENLNGLMNLQTLILSFNEIEEIELILANVNQFFITDSPHLITRNYSVIIAALLS